MEKTPMELHCIATQYEPLKILLDETNVFATASGLHKELERTAWEWLERKGQTSLALSVLFYQGKKDKSAEDDYGSLSVAFDSVKLIENGTPAVSERFVCELNQCLLTANTAQHTESRVNLNDAFGIPFQAIEEPMPWQVALMLLCEQCSKSNAVRPDMVKSKMQVIRFLLKYAWIYRQHWSGQAVQNKKIRHGSIQIKTKFYLHIRHPCQNNQFHLRQSSSKTAIRV